jgi:Pyruvate/2-oxoacid:ferredoxin oxidoreductase gamma subunit
VHIARSEVLSPASPEPHALIAFNAPSLNKFGPTVKENGIIVYDSSVITSEPEYRQGVRAIGVPCSEIAKSLGRVIIKNVVALGALQEATKVLKEESFLEAVRQSLKNKCALIPMNEEAFNWGVKAVREEITRFTD